jgi:hypothetical protein
MRGSHPEGTTCLRCTDCSTASRRFPPDRGLLPAETWRLHPNICGFTSELFYAGRPHSRPHQIEFRVDHINNQPKIIHTKTATPIEAGTKFTINWPPKLGLLENAAGQKTH